MKKYHLSILYSLLFVPLAGLSAPNLTAEVPVDIQSSNAAVAKKEALETATRNGIIMVLSRYADRAAVENAAAELKPADLANMTASTSISGEKLSKTGYSAVVAVSLEQSAVEKFYNTRQIQNFLNMTADSEDRTEMVILLDNGLDDWASVNKILNGAADENLGFQVKTLGAGQAAISVLSAKQKKFTNLMTQNGWQYARADDKITFHK